jgi:hypothetical protein
VIVGRPIQSINFIRGHVGISSIAVGRAWLDIEKHITALESKLKAAEQKLTDLETERIKLKTIGAEYWQTLCHYDHDDISTPWPYSTGGNRQSSAIKQLKAAEEKAALSVPFEAARFYCKHFCEGSGYCRYELRYEPCDTPDNCPIIPKVKTDE